jgi:hypothetical protein
MPWKTHVVENHDDPLANATSVKHGTLEIPVFAVDQNPVLDGEFHASAEHRCSGTARKGRSESITSAIAPLPEAASFGHLRGHFGAG